MTQDLTQHGAAPTGAVFVSTYQIREAGRSFIERREALMTKAYMDENRVWTIGIGHTAGAGAPYPCAGMVISEADARAIFARDLRQYVAAVNTHLTRACTQGQGDAMTSLCFNIGVRRFAASEVVRWFNAGDMVRAEAAFMNWRRPNLKSRRELEQLLFRTGEYR